MLDWNLARVREVMAATGATETYEVPLWGTGFATCWARRSWATIPRPASDRWGRAHDVANLFVMDSSVFVTGGAVNPGATILALALRAAEHLADERRTQATPT